ncbi:zinc finger domain-containing protein [Streptomyces sp. NPDC002067]
MTTRSPAAVLPQLSVPCPRCDAPAHQLCTSHSGTRQRRNDTHMDRRAAWNAAGRPEHTGREGS